MRRLIVLMLLHLCCNTLHAKILNDIYRAEVPVADQSVEARRHAVRAALLQVLVKASGHSDIVTTVVLPKRMQSVVQSYQYRTLPGDTEEAPERIFLRVRFNPSSVQTLLAPQKAWSTDRPVIAFWLLAPDAAERAEVSVPDQDSADVIVRGDVHEPIQQAFKEAAQLRGLPVVFPKGDETAEVAVTIADIRKQAWPVLQQNTESLHADGVVTGRIQRDADGRLTGKLNLHLDGVDRSWQASSEDVSTLAAALIGDMAETLAERYTSTDVLDGEKNEVQLVVQAPTDMALFAKLQRYLSQLSGVTQVEVRGMGASHVQFELQLQSSIDALKHQIALDHYLQALPAKASILQYRLPAS